MKVPAKNILLTSRRFDLIFKYVYLRDRRKCPDFYRAFYLEHIRAFNGFDEFNAGMQRVGEKLGFAREGVMKDAQLKGGMFNNVVFYGKVNAE